MTTWDAREWVAGLLEVDRADLAVRSIDRYGAQETQVRYERDGQAVVRLTVKGPVREMLELEGQGRWAISALIGSGTSDIHNLSLPETDEIVY